MFSVPAVLVVAMVSDWPAAKGCNVIVSVGATFRVCVTLTAVVPVALPPATVEADAPVTVTVLPI